jgi:ABC-type transport system involved in multi-copper enzyme maturation permease subunit
MVVFFYDLLRTTRRGRATLLRTLYALALFAALYSVYARWSSRDKAAMGALPPSEMAKFAEEFFGRFLLIQTCAVVLLTPVYTAGAIAEERQRGTLDCLLTTHLTPRTIVFGKYLARLTHLFGILLTGLPVLALLPLWGGVDPWKVVAAFAVTATSTASLGAFGLWCSASARTVRGAVAGTYALAAIFCVCPMCACVNPFAPILTLTGGDPLADLLGFTSLGVVQICQVPLTVILLFAAERDLRLSGRPGWTPAADVLRMTPSFSSPLPPPHLLPPIWRPPVGDRPLLWKELHVGGGEWIDISMPLWAVMLTLGLGLCLMLSLAGAITGKEEARAQVNFAVRVMAVLLLSVIALGTLLRAAASVGREREQKTLDMLLTLPNGRAGLLETKWLGSIICGRWAMLGLLVALGMGILGGGVHPIGVLLLAIVAGTHLTFIASLGIYLSVAIPSTGRASLVGLVILFLVCLAPFVVWPGGIGSVLPVAWVVCLPRTVEPNTWLHDPGVAMSLPLGVIAYAGLAAGFWLLTVRRFRREADQAAVAA